MIRELLPASVAVVEMYTDPPEAVLWPEEESAVANAVEKRRREYATVRYCARRALAALGRAPVAIVTGEQGAPTWPEGVVGSMTHCDGFRASAVTLGTSYLGVGVDAEPHAPLPAGVLTQVAVPAEIDMLRRLSARVPDVHWDRVLFSAKESVYKAWYPLAHRWLDFEDAELVFDLGVGAFLASIQAPGPVSSMIGRFSVHSGLVGTAVTVSPEPPSNGRHARRTGT